MAKDKKTSREKFIEIIYSSPKSKETKNMRGFCKYHKVGYTVSKLEDCIGEPEVKTIGLAICGKFIPYDYFLENHLEVGDLVEEIRKSKYGDYGDYDYSE